VPFDPVAELVGSALEGASDFAASEVHRRTGWQGCLALILIPAVAIGLLLWWLGAFSGA
jgi:hypothetical protein